MNGMDFETIRLSLTGIFFDSPLPWTTNTGGGIVSVTAPSGGATVSGTVSVSGSIEDGWQCR